ncbi:MAG: GntR family transcriptional regulator [Rhodospirillales bacterium]|nr:GntR family transcriptional regulator [Rhodospirillales bacterium]
MTEFEPITRKSLHTHVVDRLRDMISGGELQPGTRINERALCERFGISRTPLREALKVLGSEGLLDLMPNRGATVARLTREVVNETFPVMGALESLSGELACAAITDTELAEIRAIHYQMVVHYEKGELPEYFHLNQEIHEHILKAARNPLLTDIYRSVAGRVSPARYRANMSKTRWAQAVEEHDEILRALEARDGKLLSRLLKQHLENKRLTVSEALFSEEEESADQEGEAVLQTG